MSFGGKRTRDYMRHEKEGLSEGSAGTVDYRGGGQARC